MPYAVYKDQLFHWQEIKALFKHSDINVSERASFNCI